MKDELFKRRMRMMHLLPLNNLKTTMETISKEFNIPVKTAYSDYYRMDDWAPAIHQHKQLKHIQIETLNFLKRKFIELMLEVERPTDKPLPLKERFFKVYAGMAAYKINQEITRLAQNMGYIERKPLEILEIPSGLSPYESDPELRRAIVNSIEEQTREKQLAQEALERKKKEQETVNATSEAKLSEATTQTNG